MSAPTDMDLSTLPPSQATGVSGPPPGPDAAALVLVWSRDSPERVGELLLLPPHEPGPWTFGRGEGRGDPRRIALARQIPGALVSTGALACPRISRAQLRLSPGAGGGVRVENAGSCALVHEGRKVDAAEVAPGGMVALENELLFLCVRRAQVPPLDDPGLPLHPFGGPDAFGIVGESPAIWELRQRVVAVARLPFHVLIEGVSGSGKELVAQAIHARSARGRRAMVSRNAATIPEGLADAELFGNVRSYPNAGMPERPGLVGEAHESTLFLDELSELPHGLQAHLLRVMDHGEYQRLGEATTRRADLRILAATNRPAEEIKPDVLARLKVRVAVPDLHARREDIPLLVAHLLRQQALAGTGLARRFFPDGDPSAAPLVSPGLIEALVRHRYTTHVRELETLLLGAALEGRGRYLELGPQTERVLHATPPGPPGKSPSAGAVPAGVSSAALTGLEALTPEEQARLSLLRKHRFSPTACGRDPAYPGNRQTADLHLRQLLCKALEIAGWDVQRAAALLAGEGDAAAPEKCAARLSTFVANLRERMRAEPGDALRRALDEEWKGSAEGAIRLVEALRAGKVTGAPVG